MNSFAIGAAAGFLQKLLQWLHKGPELKEEKLSNVSLLDSTISTAGVLYCTDSTSIYQKLVDGYLAANSTPCPLTFFSVIQENIAGIRAAHLGAGITFAGLR